MSVRGEENETLLTSVCVCVCVCVYVGLGILARMGDKNGNRGGW